MLLPSPLLLLPSLLLLLLLLLLLNVAVDLFCFVVPVVAVTIVVLVVHADVFSPLLLFSLLHLRLFSAAVAILLVSVAT